MSKETVKCNVCFKKRKEEDLRFAENSFYVCKKCDDYYYAMRNTIGMIVLKGGKL